MRDLGSIPVSGRSPGEGKSYPLQYSGLENPRDGGAWWAPGNSIFGYINYKILACMHEKTCTSLIKIVNKNRIKQKRKAAQFIL